MKRYFDPEMEVVSFEIADVTNWGGDNTASAPDDFWGKVDFNW